MNFFSRLILSILCLLSLSSPAHAKIVVLGDLTRSYKLAPGETYEAIVELDNRDPVVKKVQVYQTDYRYLANGDNFFPKPGTYNRSNASWISFSPKIVTVLPHQKAQIKYLIRVPKDATMTGAYWSMLMVQDMSDVDSRKPFQGEQVLVPTFRYGVKIITQVGSTGKIDVGFISANVINSNSKRSLVIDIENRGSRLAKPEIWIEVFNNNGEKAGRFVTEPGNILPGCSIRREIDMSSLPKGVYNSLVIADCGQKDVYGLDLKLVLQ
jgi:hypothetical protein